MFTPASQSRCQSDSSQLDDQLDLEKNQTEGVEVDTSEDSEEISGSCQCQSCINLFSPHQRMLLIPKCAVIIRVSMDVSHIQERYKLAGIRDIPGLLHASQSIKSIVPFAAYL